MDGPFKIDDDDKGLSIHSGTFYYVIDRREVYVVQVTGDEEVRETFAKITKV